MKIVIETKKGIHIIDASNWTIAEFAEFINSQDIITINYIH